MFIYNLTKRSMWIRRALHNMVSAVEGLSASSFKDASDIALVRQVNREVEFWLTTDEALMLLSLARVQASLPGEMAELGVYQAGSARLIGEVKGDIALHLFDTFAGLPDPMHHDAGMFTSGTFQSSLPQVQAYLQRIPNTHYYPGLFPQTSDPVADRKFSFVFLDADLYQSIFDGILFFYPRLVPGGVIAIHDGQLPGVRKAIQDQGFAGQVISGADSLRIILKR